MEKVAASLAINAEKIIKTVAINQKIANTQRLFGQTQLRAYLSVRIGGAFFQDQNFRFSSNPMLVNTGQTHARRIKYRVGCGVLPVPIPDGFKYPLSPEVKGSNLIGPQQNGTINIVCPEIFPASEIKEIKLGVTRSFYVWGVVSYQDVFGERHKVTFAQQIRWRLLGSINQDWSIDEKVEGFYLGKHNRTN